ncbi:MAG: ParB/RepB/Spo0J family partition protein [Clostridiaceae bacterium]|nr:ParB/RepB/Spo0J family partition protein [Clostridiaceae bacterium]
MRKGLGKGLDALLGSVNNLEDSKNNILEVKINEVEPNIDQPRKEFDEEKLKALADSIKEHGVVQPIIVRSEGKRYVIVAGERRWRASKLAGLKTIPVIVKDLTSKEVMEIALIENLQREDLNPIEEAEAYQKLIKEYGMTQEEVAKVVGKSRAAIANSVRLLTLAEEIKEMLKAGSISSGHARTLVTINDKNRQKELANKIVQNNLNVRETEKLVSKETTEKKVPEKTLKKEEVEVSALEEKLKTIYGTKVNLSKSSNKGKIVIEYYSKEEFDRIIELLLK